MGLDYIYNGQAHGSVASRLLACNMDVGTLRPFQENGQAFITANGNAITTNAPAPFTKDAWIYMDRVVGQASQQRLNFVNDLRAAGLQEVIPNGMGTTMFQYQDESDITDAEISMSPTVTTKQDRPEYSLKGIPMPVIHKDVVFGIRDRAISQNNIAGYSLDMSMLRLKTRKVSETAEKLAIGIGTPFTIGGGTLYGITTFPQRLTKVINNPTGGTWTPQKTYDDVAAMKDQARAASHFGPFKVYCSGAWDRFMDADYSAAYPGITLRDRIKKMEGIQGVMTLDFLPGYRLMLVQMTDDTMRMVIGMEVVPVQWTEMGGMEIHMKVMTIMVPNPRADFYDQTGIIDGNV